MDLVYSKAPEIDVCIRTGASDGLGPTSARPPGGGAVVGQGLRACPPPLGGALPSWSAEMLIRRTRGSGTT